MNDLGETRSGPCEICSTDGPLCLDHDHTTKQARGWLCKKCNTGLGMFKDSRTVVAAALNYLSRAQ